MLPIHIASDALKIVMRGEDKDGGGVRRMRV
jgi:hypothetical protein